MNISLMTIDSLCALLGWCAVANLALLLVWFAGFFWAHDAMYGWHRGWFRLTPETFDAIHYAGMATYKILIWMFLIIPYLVLRLAF
ncbi:MAG: hypothetical protein LBP94_04405 [Zoogloeaceae bacterium]|jgi:hypothetical protein|nr:hypothetical protein [Zoogloeaceae bacterium]